jgi:hypothetical protein
MRDDHAQVAHSRDAIARGIRYATDHGAQIISMSLGGGKLFYNGNPLEEAAIKYALGKGVVLVASSGNDGATGNRRNYPAAYPGVIAVGAVDRTFKPAKFTNRHAYVSVAAPGVEIVSADASGRGYVLGTGTSSSAALVAGMGALVKARYPHLTPGEVKQALEQGTTHRPADGRNSAVGTGVADALGSLRAAGRVNKAEHGGASVKQPESSAAPDTNGSSAKGGPDLVLVAVLSGGGTLLVLSLILGWRQRRRRLAAAQEDDEDVVAPIATPSPAEADPWRPRPPARTPRQGRSSGPSPWEPRPSEPSSSWEPLPPDPTPGRSPHRDVSAGRDDFDPSAWGSSGPSPWPRRPEPPSWRQPSPSDPLSGADPSPAAGSPAAPLRFSGTGDRSPAEPPSAGPAPAGPPRTEPFSVPGLPPTGGRPPIADSGAPSAPPPPPGPVSPAAPVPSSDGPLPAAPVRPPGAPEPHEPAPRPPSSEHGDGSPSSGRFPAVTQDFRTVGEPDPLSDGPIDSSSDVGTPLADESWESIRRGFDRLKEDTRNWGSQPLLGAEDGTGWSSPWSSPGETAKPPAKPDDESET